MQQPTYYNNAAEVTKHDTTRNEFIGFITGGAGNVKVTLYGGGVVTFTAVPVGVVIPVHTILIWSAGTTSTGIIGLLP
jgi:hypothetical protein